MARPFSRVGIDYFGPILVKIQNQPAKVYGALFTCLVIRAIHLEVSLDLSGNTFLQAYRRFIVRRGIPSIIFSDNATNFQVRAKIIKKCSNQTWLIQEVQQWVSHKGTKWKFTTPRNPREGGAWERMIGVVKNSLRRSIGRKLLDHSELETLFCELEAMVNSRPLTYQSDFEPIRSIRPIDFIIPQASPEINFANLGDESDYEELNREQGLKNIKAVNKKLNKLWEIWKTQYLLSLRERVERGVKNIGKEPQFGDIVIVEEDLPRPLWKLGKIIELIKGRDGFVRTVKLNLNGKIFKRSITQIYPLEISQERPPQQRLLLDRNIEKEMDCSSDEDISPFPAKHRVRTAPLQQNPELVMMATVESSLAPFPPRVRDMREERALMKAQRDREQEDEEILVIKQSGMPILPAVRDRREDAALTFMREKNEKERLNEGVNKIHEDAN